MTVRLILRNLAAHRLRLLFTALAVMLGAAFVSGTMIFRDTSARSFDTLFDRVSTLADVTVQPKQDFTSEDAPRRLIPESLLTDLSRKVPGAQGFRGALDGYAAVVRPDGQVVGGDGLDHVGLTYVDRPGSDLTMNSGRAPTADGEVAVESRTATDGNIKVGDSIDVTTQYASQPMRVVGVFTLNQEGFTDVFTFVGFAPETAQKLLAGAAATPGNRQYSAIWARAAEGVTQQQLVAQINAALPAGYEAKTGDDLAKDNKAKIQQVFTLLGRFLLAFAAISVLVGSFIIFNTFGILIAQRTRELALLRAIGASRAQVTRGVLGEATGIGFLGATLGLLTGVGVAVVLRLLLARLGVHLPAHAPVITPRTLVWTYAVGLAVTVAAAYLPAHRASRTPPVAALRADVVMPRRSLTLRLVVGAVLGGLATLAVVAGVGDGGQAGGGLVVVGAGVMFLAAVVLGPVLSRPVIRVVGWPLARLAGVAGRLSRENARRDPRRTAATASALMVGLALVSLATVLASSSSASIDRRLDREFGADYVMEPTGLSGFSPAAVDRVAAVPGVRSVAPVQFGALKVDGRESAVVVADPRALVIPARLKLDSGTTTLGADEILVQRTLAREHGWQVGSTVAGQYPDGAAATLRVAGIFADNQLVNRQYLMSPDSYRRHVGTFLLQKAFVDLDDQNQARARAAVQSALGAYPNIRLKDRQEAKADAREEVEQVLDAIVVLLGLSIAIAALGIANTMSLSAIERTREIGLLRAVGMGRRQVRSMIRYEAVVIALFGATLGLALGVLVGWAAQRVLTNDGLEVLDIPLDRLALYLLSCVVIGVVAALWPAWRAARMNVLAAIHHE
jgi:putative ABC transport system permease protein